MFKTLTLRLVTWYTGLFVLMSLTVYALFIYTLSAELRQRVDEELIEDGMELLKVFEESPDIFPSYIEEELAASEVENEFILVLAVNKQPIASTDLHRWQGLVPLLKQIDTLPTLPWSIDLDNRESLVRVHGKQLATGANLFIGTSLEDDEELLATLRLVYSFITLMMITGGILLGWLMIRHSLAGVRRVQTAADAIQKGNLEQRVEIGKEGLEIEQLATSFNLMLDHIEKLIRELKEMSQNVAHDLRSPITRVRGICETTLIADKEIKDYREMAVTTIDEMDRLVHLINTMLEIAEIDSRQTTFSSVTVNLEELVGDLVELYEPLAQKKDIQITVEQIIGKPVILGDRSKLQRAIANLVDNSVKYTPTGGKITIRLDAGGDTIALFISDSGIGIKQEHIARIFERFYRADTCRTTPGNGLGLSLSRSIIEGHGGRISVDSMPGNGCTFKVALPRLPEYLDLEDKTMTE
jgi:heavy metal sensor kinase